MQLQEERNHTIDFIRGVLAINICVFHFVFRTIYITDGNLLAELSVLNPFRYNLFFLISGFMIPMALSIN